MQSSKTLVYKSITFSMLFIVYWLPFFLCVFRHRLVHHPQMINNGPLELPNTILVHDAMKHLAWVIKECFHHTKLVLFLSDFMQYQGRMYFQIDLTNQNVSFIWRLETVNLVLYASSIIRRIEQFLLPIVRWVRSDYHYGRYDFVKSHVPRMS